MTAHERLAKTHEMLREILDLWNGRSTVTLYVEGVNPIYAPLAGDGVRASAGCGDLYVKHRDESTGVPTLVNLALPGERNVVECSRCKAPIVSGPDLSRELTDYAAASHIATSLVSNGAEDLCPTCFWATCVGEDQPDNDDPEDPNPVRADCNNCGHVWHLKYASDQSDTCDKCGSDDIARPAAEEENRDLLVECECGKCGQRRALSVGPDGEDAWHCTNCDESEATEVGGDEHSTCPKCSALNASVAFGNGSHFTCRDCKWQWSLPPDVHPYDTKRAKVSAPSQTGGAE